MSDHVTTQHTSIHQFSSRFRDIVRRNLPETEPVLFCYETKIQTASEFDRRLYFQFSIGVITKHWLLSIYVTENELNPEILCGEQVQLIQMSKVKLVERKMLLDPVLYSQLPYVSVIDHDSHLDFYFDTQALSHKVEEILLNAVRDAQPGYRNEIKPPSTQPVVEDYKNQQALKNSSVPPIRTTHRTKPKRKLRTILFLAADPTDASRLRLGEELREIQEKLQLAKMRELFELHQRMSVRPIDISQALLDVQPQIVHFSGHGAATGVLCIENQVGESHFIQPNALAALFKQFAKKVNCVILNACYSEVQAKAIAQHINYVIGMNQAIGDKAAIAFSVGFYQALGAGCTIEQAYELGCVQIGLQDIPEYLIPVLITKH